MCSEEVGGWEEALIRTRDYCNLLFHENDWDQTIPAWLRQEKTVNTLRSQKVQCLSRYCFFFFMEVATQSLKRLKRRSHPSGLPGLRSVLFVWISGGRRYKTIIHPVPSSGICLPSLSPLSFFFVPYMYICIIKQLQKAAACKNKTPINKRKINNHITFLNVGENWSTVNARSLNWR